MAITHFGNKMLRGVKADRVNDSLGSSADGTNSGITLMTTSGTESQSGTGENKGLGQSMTGGNATKMGFTVATGHALVGTTATKISLYLWKDGSPTGNGSMKIYNSSGTLQATSTNTVSWSGLGSSSWGTKTDFTFTGHTLVNGDRMVIEGGTTDDSNRVFASMNTGTASNTNTVYYSDSWRTISNAMKFDVEYTGSDAVKLGTGAYSFDGSNDYVQTSTKFNYLHDGTGGSIAFWVKPRNLASVHNNGDLIFDSMATSAGSGTGIQIRFKTDKGMRFNFTNSSNGWFTNVNSTTTFADDTWYHVAMTFGSSTVKVYVNGTLEDTETFSNPNTNASGGNFTIGRHATDPSSYGYFDGVLDDIGIYKRVLTATEISDLVNKTGDVDGLGSSADGTVTGATLDTTNEKLGSGCFSFDGSGDQVIFGSASDWSFLNSGEDFSLVFWLRPSATNATQALFSTMSDASGSNKGFSVSMTSSNQINLAVYPSAGGGYPFANDVGTSVFDANQWNHYALVYTKSDGNMRVYKNGSVIITQAKNGTFTAGTPSYAMMFGQRGDGGDRDYNGQVDDSAVFERALSSTEVSNLYNSGTGALVSTISTTGLKAYWNFDQNPPTNQASPTINGALVSSLTDKSNLKAYYSMNAISGTGGLTSEVSSYITADTANSRLKFVVKRGQGSGISGWIDTGLTSSSSNWAIKFKLNVPTRSVASNNVGYFAFSSSTVNQDSDYSGKTGNAIGYYINLRSSGETAAHGQQAVQAGNTYSYNLINDANSLQFSSGSTEYTKWIKIVKNGNTVNMTIHDSESDADSGTLSSGSDTSTGTNSTAGGFTNLRYLKWYNVAGGSTDEATIYFSDLKLYDDTTSTSGTPTKTYNFDGENCVNDYSSTSDLDAMTNLPENTIFLQTDDTPHYRWLQSGVWELDAKSAIAFWSTAATSAIFAKGATYSGNYAKQSSTMEWNGSAWSSGANTNTAAYFCGGIGNKTGGMVMGGTTADAGANSASNVSEKYDGSSWSATGTLNSSTSGSPFGGISSSAFGATVWGGGGASPATTSQSWNNTSWSSSTNCATASRFGAGDGNSNTNFFLVGGNDSNTDRAEIWNGTAWSAGVSFSGSGTLDAGRGSGGAGYGSTNFIALSDDGTNHVYTFDGTSWTLASGTASDKDSAGIGGDKNKAITASGWSSGSFTNGSESWNGTSWSTNGNLTASIGSGGMGASA